MNFRKAGLAVFFLALMVGTLALPFGPLEQEQPAALTPTPAPARVTQPAGAPTSIPAPPILTYPVLTSLVLTTPRPAPTNPVISYPPQPPRTPGPTATWTDRPPYLTICYTEGFGTYFRAEPNGRLLVYRREGSAVQIHGLDRIVDGQKRWRNVSDPPTLVGWIEAEHLCEPNAPATPLPTPTIRLTPTRTPTVTPTPPFYASPTPEPTPAFIISAEDAIRMVLSSPEAGSYARYLAPFPAEWKRISCQIAGPSGIRVEAVCQTSLETSGFGWRVSFIEAWAGWRYGGEKPALESGEFGHIWWFDVDATGKVIRRGDSGNTGPWVAR